LELPEVFIFDASDNEDDAALDLRRRIASLEIEAPFVVASVHGARLAEGLSGPRPPQRPIDGADQEWAAELGSEAKRSGADAVVAIGGGRCLDIAKLAAARAGLTLVAVPTQLSHDGICSPVAVVPGADGRAESVGAVEPRAVFVSLPTIVGAPAASVAAGLGDLLANPLALRDWTLAGERGLEEVDGRAWDLSVESYESIASDLDRDPQELAGDPEFLGRLANALVLSGMAMIQSGDSRPASGGEHEISHAIDHLYGGRALHGAQVAFGCVISLALYGEPTGAFRERLVHMGLPAHPRDLGLDAGDTLEMLLEAPNTRPGRFTILEHANLDDPSARRLIAEIWPDL
jgi:glycerol-1-phosphate dehydrogenase [NAD(P)+]